MIISTNVSLEVSETDLAYQLHGLVGSYLDIWQCLINDKYLLGLDPRIVGKRFIQLGLT